MISRLYLNLKGQFNRNKVVIYGSRPAATTQIDGSYIITEWVTRVADELDDHDYPVYNEEIEESDRQIEAGEGIELTPNHC